MTWKTEQPSEVGNLANYESAIEAAKSELDNLSQSIKIALSDRDNLINGNNEILRSKLDELNDREKCISERRSKADELHASAEDKYINLLKLSEEISKNIEEVNRNKSELAKDFKKELEKLSLKEEELKFREESLNVREDLISKSEKILQQLSLEHSNVVINFRDEKLALAEQHKQADARFNEAEDAIQRVEIQRQEIFTIVNEQRTNIERLDRLRSEIEEKVNEQARLLDINTRHEDSLKDLIIEQKKVTMEAEKAVALQRKASNIMQQQKQEIEELKNQIINHNVSVPEVK